MGLTTTPQQETFSSSIASFIVPQQHCEPQQNSKECAGCGKRIIERYLLKALDIFWHEDCLKCGCCDCRLGEVGSTLYIKANLILCRRDYLRLFGNTGSCSACKKMIPAYEMVMRAKCNVYHLECFACFTCQHRFCVGDKYYLCDNKILCPYDYEERLVFAGFADNPNMSLTFMKRQLNNLQSVSEGRNIRTTNALPNSTPTPSTSNANVACLPVLRNVNSSGRSEFRQRQSGDDDASSGYDSPDPEPEEPDAFEKSLAVHQ